jgi:hypothetical protein
MHESARSSHWTALRRRTGCFGCIKAHLCRRRLSHMRWIFQSCRRGWRPQSGDQRQDVGEYLPRHRGRGRARRVPRSAPAEFLHGPAGVPDFCHVPDFVPGEIHDIDVIGRRAFAGRRAGTALAGMGGREDAIGTHAVSIICRRASSSARVVINRL